MKFVTPEISWHSRDPLYSVDLQHCKGKLRRLATCGTDKLIRLWEVKLPSEETDGTGSESKDRGNVSVEFLSSLSRHSRTVNVVRFSPDGSVLASGADDSAIILWKLSDAPPSATLFQDDEEENRETWNAFKVLRSHLEDVYDLSWSSDGKMLLSGSVDNTAILWDVKKGHKLWMFSEHKSFVQGVAFDPLCGFLATMSDDRSCRIYSFVKRQLLYDVRKLPAAIAASAAPQSDVPGQPVANKAVRMFHSADTMKSFFRRLSFSPDGQILVTPCGCVEASQSQEALSSTTYVFSRSNLSTPVLSLVGPSKPTLAVRFCPVLFELRKVPRRKTPENPADGNECEIGNQENEPDWMKYETLFKLPYRMIYAVLSENAVFLYDTQQPQPLAYLTNLHYHTLSDATWSHDGRLLVLSSTDGYCTLVSFDAGELGTKYKLQVPEVLLEAASENEEPVKTETMKPVLLQEVPSKSDLVVLPIAQPVPQTASPPVVPVKHPNKPSATKPIKRCSTKLVSVFPPTVTGSNDNIQTTKGLLSKPNMVQPTIRRLTTIQLPPPVPVADAVRQMPAVNEEPMDTGEVLLATTESTSDKVDDSAKRLCAESLDLHLELELTNDTCVSSAVPSAVATASSTEASTLQCPSSADPSTSVVGCLEPGAAVMAANQTSGKNPRRIQLTTITTVR